MIDFAQFVENVISKAISLLLSGALAEKHGLEVEPAASGLNAEVWPLPA